MLRTLNNSSLAPDQDEASSYRAVEFRVARRKLWHENDFHSRRKNNTGPKRRLGTRSPVVSPIGLAPRNALPAAHQHATSALGRGELCRKFDFNFARHRRRREIRTPCIRGMRVTVGMIVEALAAGRTIEQLPRSSSSSAESHACEADSPGFDDFNASTHHQSPGDPSPVRLAKGPAPPAQRPSNSLQST